MSKKWIQEAVDNPGRVTKYLYEVYGKRAFFNDGTIKIKYINYAIKRIKKGKGRNREGLLNALYLSKRLKKMNK